MNDSKEIVRQGYDKISFAYQADKPDPESYQHSWTMELSALLEPGSSVLELGCGCGVPVAQLLSSQQFHVTGVDISPVQIERAKTLVPDAAFMCADMCRVEFDAESFDALVCLYAIIHVPVSEHPRLIANMFKWLKPRGYLLLTVGYEAYTGTEKNWLGVEGGDMYWSHADRTTYLDWLETAGFQVVWDRFIPEGDSGHTQMLARKHS